MIEPKAGVFVGTMSAMVRERLWDRIQKRKRGGGAILIYSFANEQGFEMEMAGDTSRELAFLEGLLLVRKRKHE